MFLHLFSKNLALIRYVSLMLSNTASFSQELFTEIKQDYTVNSSFQICK